MSTPTAYDLYRAAYYNGAAVEALAKAKSFRDLWRRTGEPVDRSIMRQFAREWRVYVARARSFQS